MYAKIGWLAYNVRLKKSKPYKKVHLIKSTPKKVHLIKSTPKKVCLILRNTVKKWRLRYQIMSCSIKIHLCKHKERALGRDRFRHIYYRFFFWYDFKNAFYFGKKMASFNLTLSHIYS
jgi:hypothetical protein